MARCKLTAPMEFFRHSGFQTVEFGLLVVWAGWVLLGRDVTWRFLTAWCFLALLGSLGIEFLGERFPTLPIFVSSWRLVATLAGASIAGEYLIEWRQRRRHSISHLLGLGLAIGGVVLSWWANWEVTSATLLLGSFLTLGYCATVNRLEEPA